MKKIIAKVILFSYVFLVSINSGMASELYIVKNLTNSKLLTTVQSAFESAGYEIKNNSPVYGVAQNNDAVAIIQLYMDETYYYYFESADTPLGKSILKNIKSAGGKYEPAKNDAMLAYFDKTSASVKESLKVTKVKKYDFSETSTNSSSNYNKALNTSDDNALQGYVAEIPSGTTMDVYLQTTVNTANAAEGDEVTAALVKNWTYQGKTVAPQGSILSGSVTKAKSAGLAYKNGYVKFNFNTLTTPEGKTYSIKTEDIEFQVDSTGKAKSVATKAAVGAAAGALTGLLIGALSSSKDKNIGTTTAISAGAGLLLGLGSAALERGTDAEIPTYTEMTVKLTSPLKVVLSY